jgi:hypothetical protein
MSVWSKNSRLVALKSSGSNSAMTDRLTLFARNAEDLQAISAVLQDALVRVGDMKLYTDLNRFGLLVNRFRWEVEEAAAVVAPVETGRDQRFEGAVGYERVHCGIAFDNVRSVRMRGIDQDKRGRLLNLLAVQATEIGLRLDFSQDAAILLECEGIACQLRDLDEPWPTPWRPQHGAGEAP